jgi:hypothetical protein
MRHHHHHFGFVDAVIVGYIADRTARRYGFGPVVVIGLGIAAACANPALGALYVALCIACVLLGVVCVAMAQFHCLRRLPQR